MSQPSSRLRGGKSPEAPADPTVTAGAVAAVLRADIGDAFGFFGMHEVPAGFVVRVFQPEAHGVEVLDAATGDLVANLPQFDASGLFAGVLPRKSRFRYQLRVSEGAGIRVIDDPYRFPTVLGDLDSHLIAEGNHLRLYDKLGAHAIEIEGVAGTHFAVWAPNASTAAIVGDFNAWDGRRLPMRKRIECGVWEIFLPGVQPGALYKFEFKGPRGQPLSLKADPLAFQMELRPQTASVVSTPLPPAPRDTEWERQRARINDRSAPISIYEAHLGSWMRVPGEGNRFLTYRELGDRLIPYVRDMGFTHLQLMPVSEFPFDGSWGYQPVGMFAPTARFGTPADFAAFIARAHAEGIGVMVDWVPGHFPTDPHGLGYFDGTALYEHADPRLGFHSDWNTLIFNYGRREVANYLTAHALFWFDRYKIDGLRVDAVASMLYLDYSRKPGEWVPNRFGGNQNLEAVAFLKRLNELIFSRHPGTTTVAEESTAWPGVSRPTYDGGLGFGYKWNMGWMHDTLRYMQQDPINRRYHHNDITFGLVYAWDENFVLPLSHDEVVHGKGSLIGRMPGDSWQRFANLRAYYGFQWTHPGKKLLFQGGEFAQEREWNHDHSLDWHLLESAPHRGMQALVRDLNRVYRSTPALHQLDCDRAGFEWIDLHDSDNSVFTYLRLGQGDARPVLVVMNMTPVVRGVYRVGVPRLGTWREILNTDDVRYGGSGVVAKTGAAAEEIAHNYRPYSVALTLPPLSTLILEWTPSS